MNQAREELCRVWSKTPKRTAWLQIAAITGKSLTQVVLDALRAETKECGRPGPGKSSNNPR